jgi:hypothetical protein
MADYYVYSGAVGAGTGADWADAFTTLPAAVSGKAAGDRFFVAHDHAESAGSAKSISFPGTAASPNICLCVNRAGSVPPVSADLRTTATITTSGTNLLTVSGGAYIYGIAFSGVSGVGNTTVSFSGWLVFHSCLLRTQSSNTATRIQIAASANQAVELINTSFQFGNASQGVLMNGSRMVWRDTATPVAGATLPTTLITGVGRGIQVYKNIDFSALSGTIVGPSVTANAGNGVHVLKDCKLHASATVSSSPDSPGAPHVQVIRCDSGDTNYRQESYQYAGTLTTETTIVRTGGATDGTTPIAWKVVTTANPEWHAPFECFPITIWNETVGSAITLTVEGIWGGGAVPNNDEIWMDVEYLGTSGFPIGSTATTTKADILASGSAVTSSSEAWGGSTTAFKLSSTFTPREKGPITVLVKIAAASATFYIDPEITISGVTLGKQFVVAPGVYVNELGGAGGGGHIASRQLLGM